MKLSIIIPTLEEEKYLPLLLKSIKSQKISREYDYEVIVADASSKDKTIEIAKDYGCKITNGGLPAKGRNQGAKIAKGDLFLFLDADTILPENSLIDFLSEFEERDLGIAGFLLRPWPEEKLFKILYNFFYNWPVLITEKILPHSEGAILIKKSLFWKIKGFDEEIKLGEDSTCSRRARCFGKFGILRATTIYYSQRRLKRDGPIKTWLKYAAADLYLIFIGPIKTDIFKYDLQSKRFKE